MFYDVKLDAASPSTYGWTLASIPVITHSAQNRDRFSIPARNGELLGSEIWRGNAFVTCIFQTRLGYWTDQYGHTTIDDRYDDLFRLIGGASTLHLKTQNKTTLSAWDNAGYFNILGWAVASETRKNRDYMRIEVQFEVEPFKYTEISTTNPEYTTDTSIENWGDESCPVYYLARTSSSSAGAFTLTLQAGGTNRTISGSFPANVSEIYIDTKRQLTYYISSGVKHEVTGITGDYRKMRIPRGQVTLSKTGANTLRTYTRFGVNI